MTDEIVTEMLDTNEVVKLLGISKVTLKRWRKAGKIKALEFPSQHYRYSKQDVERILKEGM